MNNKKYAFFGGDKHAHLKYLLLEGYKFDFIKNDYDGALLMAQTYYWLYPEDNEGKSSIFNFYYEYFNQVSSKLGPAILGFNILLLESIIETSKDDQTFQTKLNNIHIAMFSKQFDKDSKIIPYEVINYPYKYIFIILNLECFSFETGNLINDIIDLLNDSLEDFQKSSKIMGTKNAIIISKRERNIFCCLVDKRKLIINDKKLSEHTNIKMFIRSLNNRIERIAA